MPHVWINQRCFPLLKVCGFHRNGVRHAPFWCAPYTVLLCGLSRFMHHEIGHLFDNHTLGGTPPPEMLRAVGVYALDGTKITGTKYGNYYVRHMGVRAPDNGYWSDNTWDEWQEHSITMEAGNNEYEDFADIFMNWTYRSFVPNKAGWALYGWTDSHMDTWLGKCGW